VLVTFPACVLDTGHRVTMEHRARLVELAVGLGASHQQVHGIIIPVLDAFLPRLDGGYMHGRAATVLNITARQFDTTTAIVMLASMLVTSIAHVHVCVGVIGPHAVVHASELLDGYLNKRGAVLMRIGRRRKGTIEIVDREHVFKGRMRTRPDLLLVDESE